MSEKIDEIENIKEKLAKKTSNNEILITNLERNRNISTLSKIAEKTNDISSITGHKALFVLKHEHEQNSIKNIPVIYTWELDNMEKNKDLEKLIKERENEGE